MGSLSPEPRGDNDTEDDRRSEDSDNRRSAEPVSRTEKLRVKKAQASQEEKVRKRELAKAIEEKKQKGRDLRAVMKEKKDFERDLDQKQTKVRLLVGCLFVCFSFPF